MRYMQELRNDIMKIYDRLEDDLSKRIFENRLLFSFTENNRFISEIVRISPVISQIRESIIAEQKSRNIIAYGAGIRGMRFAKLCADIIKITAFCDKDKGKQNKTFEGYQVISPEDLKNKHRNDCIVITQLAYSDILADLLEMGFHKDQIIIFDHYYQKILEEQYFDECLPPPSAEEVFIDAGCFDCDTARRFARWTHGNYKQIISFEPEPDQYRICVEKSKDIKDITLHLNGLWHENIDVSFSIDAMGPGASRIAASSQAVTERIKAVRLDDILNGEKATFIKMDIEGAELNALKGAEQTILKYRPRLAISLYHKPEDVWEIPSYILSLHHDYKLYVRHYYWGPYETVLYAV